MCERTYHGKANAVRRRSQLPRKCQSFGHRHSIHYIALSSCAVCVLYSYACVQLKMQRKKNLSFAHSSPMYGLAFVVLFCLIIVFVVHFIQCMPCLCGIFFLFPFFCSFNCVCWRHRGEETVKSIAVRSVFFSLGRTNFLLFKSM